MISVGVERNRDQDVVRLHDASIVNNLAEAAREAKEGGGE